MLPTFDRTVKRLTPVACEDIILKLSLSTIIWSLCMHRLMSNEISSIAVLLPKIPLDANM